MPDTANVLTVGDGPEARAMIAEYLAGHGCETDEAADHPCGWSAVLELP